MPDKRAKRIAEFIEPLRVAPGSKVNLGKDFDPGSKAKFLKKKDGEQLLRQSVEVLTEYQDRLAAQDTYGVLVVFQALDAAGKDGTIRHVMSGVNPQGVSVQVQGPVDRGARPRLPVALRDPPSARGDIAIFNRSYYEEVLVVRVHPALLERRACRSGARARSGTGGSRRSTSGSTTSSTTGSGREAFLNLSKEEQRIRFLRRIDLPEKNWKFSAADARERSYWDDYQKAFSDMLSKTSTEWAPWYVIPADQKWFARICAGAVIGNAMLEIDPRFPKVAPEAHDALQETKVPTGGRGPRRRGARPVRGRGAVAKEAKAEGKDRQEGQEEVTARRPRSRTSRRRRRASETESSDGYDRRGAGQREGATAERWYALSADEVAGAAGRRPDRRLARCQGRRATAEGRA